MTDYDEHGGITSKKESYRNLEHLPYLTERRSVLWDAEDNPRLENKLLCAACGHPATSVSESIEFRGRHDHVFQYFGEVVYLGCYRNAPGCVGVQRISKGYSWFRGYTWQIQVCRNCYSQLGWKYVSQDDAFYALVFKLLREEEQKEEQKDEGPML